MLFDFHEEINKTDFCLLNEAAKIGGGFIYYLGWWFKESLFRLKTEDVLDKKGQIIHHRGVSAAEGFAGNDAEYIVKQMNGE